MTTMIPASASPSCDWCGECDWCLGITDEAVDALAESLCTWSHFHAMNGTSPVPCGGAQNTARYHLRRMAREQHGGWRLAR